MSELKQNKDIRCDRCRSICDHLHRWLVGAGRMLCDACIWDDRQKLLDALWKAHARLFHLDMSDRDFDGIVADLDGVLAEVEDSGVPAAPP